MIVTASPFQKIKPTPYPWHFIKNGGSFYTEDLRHRSRAVSRQRLYASAYARGWRVSVINEGVGVRVTYTGLTKAGTRIRQKSFVVCPYCGIRNYNQKINIQ